MRISYIAAVLVTAVVGTVGVGATVFGASPVNAPSFRAHSATLHVHSATLRNMIMSRSGIPEAPIPRLPVAGLGEAYDLPKLSDNSRLFAQLKPVVAMPEASTGNPSLPPLKWVGLLVVPHPTPQDPHQIKTCTAQFISATVLLTAAHCLKDLPADPMGPWPDVTKGTFWLQYQNDEGTPFKIVCGATNPKWTLPAEYTVMTPSQQKVAMNAAWQHDFAMILVEGKSPTGAMRYALDWKGKMHEAVRVGYPHAILGSAIVQQVPGTVFFADQIQMDPDLLPNIVVQWGPLTDFTRGSSGGAWIANFSTTDGPNNNVLIAVTSFYYTDMFPGAMFAAYLTSTEFNPMLTSVTNGCK